VKHLHQNNIPIALATGSHRSVFDIKISRYQQFFSLFHHVVCGSSDPDVEHGKPHPDIFLVAAQRFEDPPSPKKVYIQCHFSFFCAITFNLNSTVNQVN